MNHHSISSQQRQHHQNGGSASIVGSAVGSDGGGVSMNMSQGYITGGSRSSGASSGSTSNYHHAQQRQYHHHHHHHQQQLQLQYGRNNEEGGKRSGQGQDDGGYSNQQQQQQQQYSTHHEMDSMAAQYQQDHHFSGQHQHQHAGQYQPKDQYSLPGGGDIIGGRQQQQSEQQAYCQQQQSEQQAYCQQQQQQHHNNLEMKSHPDANNYSDDQSADQEGRCVDEESYAAAYDGDDTNGNDTMQLAADAERQMHRGQRHHTNTCVAPPLMQHHEHQEQETGGGGVSMSVIMAAASELHEMVGHALRLGGANDDANINNNSNDQDEDDGGNATTEDRGRRRSRKRQYDTAGTAGPSIGSGCRSSTYERRRAARRVLRGLTRLEEVVGSIDEDSWTMASIKGGSNDELQHQKQQQQQQEEVPLGEQGEVSTAGCHERDDADATEGTDGDSGRDNSNSNDNHGSNSFCLTLQQMISDLTLIPTDVRGALLLGEALQRNSNGADASDNDGGNSGVVSLLDHADAVACRIIMQLMKKAGGIPSSFSFLPKRQHVDALLGRALTVCEPSSDSTYPPYSANAAAIMSVVNCICREYATQNLPLDISSIDAFRISQYCARRGLADLTGTASSAPTTNEFCHHNEAAMQLRKLIVVLLSHLLQCLGNGRSKLSKGASNKSFNLLDALIADPRRMDNQGHQDAAASAVRTEDVEDYCDLLSEYCTELTEYALDLLELSTSLVRSTMAGGNDVAAGDQGGKVSQIHADSLRESTRSTTIALATFSILRQLSTGIHPDPSTLKALVVHLANFVAGPCHELLNMARKPLRDGGAARHILADLQNSVDAADDHLIHICKLVMPVNAPIGRQRGGSKRKKVDSEQQSALAIAIVSALSRSQHGGSSKDLSSLLESLVKQNEDDRSTTVIRPTAGRRKMNCGKTLSKKQRSSSVHDETAHHNHNDVTGGAQLGSEKKKEKSVVILKQSNSRNVNVANACLLSSLLMPEYPSLAPKDKRRHQPNAFEESYKTAAAVSNSTSVGEPGCQSLIDPANPWHAFISRKIFETVAKRDASGIGIGDNNTAASEARTALLRHAHICQPPVKK